MRPAWGADSVTYWLSFRIRKVYYDAIVAGTKTAEFRKASPFWVKRAARAKEELENGRQVGAVFVCGALVHRRDVPAVRTYSSALEALGRPPSEQGAQDLGPGYVFGFHLGRTL